MKEVAISSFRSEIKFEGLNTFVTASLSRASGSTKHFDNEGPGDQVEISRLATPGFPMIDFGMYARS